MTVQLSREFQRQYRVAQQTLSMHAVLRDRYAHRTFLLKSLMLVASVVFCATAFAGDDVFNWFGVTPASGRIALRICSVLSFSMSVWLLLAGWDAAAARHSDAVKRFTDVVAQFRKFKDDPGGSGVLSLHELQGIYWKANQESTPIPTSQFASLKARCLLDIAVSRMLDSAPGCPPLFLRLILRVRGMWRGARVALKEPLDDGNHRSPAAVCDEPGGLANRVSDGQGASH